MTSFIGCDIGTVSVKAAIVTDDPRLINHLESRQTVRPLQHIHPLLGAKRIFLSSYRRLKGDPLQATFTLLEELLLEFPPDHRVAIGLTGAHGPITADRLGAEAENDVKAAARGIGQMYPEASHIFDIGGENSRYISIHVDAETGEGGIADYATNGDCAAGTGSFMDQQASRLRYDIEEVGEIARSAERAAKIAGRCSVFAKSDMIHAQQRGAGPPEILKGLCEAVARNFKSNVVRGRKIQGQIAIIGGVATNSGIVEAAGEIFRPEADILVPEAPAFWSAIGAALLQHGKNTLRADHYLQSLGEVKKPREEFPSWPKLSLGNVRLLREETEAYNLPPGNSRIDAFLGLDIGSVSTNLVCIDSEGEIIHDIYLRTEARPIEVVSRGLAEIENKLGGRLNIKGVGTTGSGRELIGELIGADTVNDEITAHKTGAFQIASRYLGTEVDTIFEIGGQDSKYISLRDGVVVNFTMNEACAAGTGSFLEEQAEKLGLNIIGEFAETAMGAEHPIRLGERCTVYMEQDVTSYQRRGADRADLVAGLAYSVVQNFLNRVVGNRPIGEVIFFQGGTAYNDSVAAAFASVLGKRIIVPPYNGVVGAYGAALLARTKFIAVGEPTSFRGFRVSDTPYQVREFTCQACSNLCDIHEFNIAGEKTFWGDKCSERYRREAKSVNQPVIPDLMKVREEALMRNYFLRFLNGEGREEICEMATRAAQDGANAAAGRTIGIPMAMYTYDRLPFWGTYLRAVGFNVRLSPPTSKKLADRGVQEAVADPCFPIQVAHGHVLNLLEAGIEHIFLPSIISSETVDMRVQSYMCPWGQTLPFVMAAHPQVSPEKKKLLTPIVHFREGMDVVEKELWKVFASFSASRSHHRAAVTLASEAQGKFQGILRQAGAEALKTLEETGEPGIVLVGRTYNIYDRGINLNIPEKLRSLYGINVIPHDFLPIDDVSIDHVTPNMFWNNGRRILQATSFTGSRPWLHLIYITNFICGPDSYLKQFAQELSGKPFLTLQFDSHGNDAGMLTRCEAYLDSKGVLRWWQKVFPSTEELSTYQECATAAAAPSPRRSAPRG